MALPLINPRADSAQSDDTWLILAIVIPAVVTVIALAIFIFWRFRRRGYRGVDSADRNANQPYMADNEKGHARNLSDLDRAEQEELQRSFMIRKSLASRTSSRTDSRLDQVLSEEPLNMADEDLDQDIADQQPGHKMRSVSLRDDWKEWEARLCSERSGSLDLHPAIIEPVLKRQDSPPHVHNKHSPPLRSNHLYQLPMIPSQESLSLLSSPPPVATTTVSPWEKPKFHITTSSTAVSS